jgi:hypothetical protein
MNKWHKSKHSNVVLCLNKDQVLKIYGGVEVQLHVLCLIIHGGIWSASHPAALPLGEATLNAHWLGG